MGHYSDVIADLVEPTMSQRDANHDVWSGFGQLHKAAVADGALSAKTKELIALTIAVVKQCDGCIGYHIVSPNGPFAPTSRARSEVR